MLWRKIKARTTEWRESGINVSLEIGHFSRDLKAVVEWGWRLVSEELKIAKEEDRDRTETLETGAGMGQLRPKQDLKLLQDLWILLLGTSLQLPSQRFLNHTLRHRNWCETGLCPQWHWGYFQGFQPRRNRIFCCHWSYTVETMHQLSILLLCRVYSIKAWGL